MEIGYGSLTKAISYSFETMPYYFQRFIFTFNISYINIYECRIKVRKYFDVLNKELICLFRIHKCFALDKLRRGTPASVQKIPLWWHQKLRRYHLWRWSNWLSFVDGHLANFQVKISFKLLLQQARLHTIRSTRIKNTWSERKKTNNHIHKIKGLLFYQKMRLFSKRIFLCIFAVQKNKL